MDDFDAHDKDSWYIGMMLREEINSLLNAERDSGVFLVRDSSTIKGDFVLSVKEGSKVSHYIINSKTGDSGAMRFHIGDMVFPSIPELLTFYKTHYLDTTCLVRPAKQQKFITKYKFEGKDADDLPFDKGEILSLIRKDEEQWWTACNSRGQKGLIPVPYIERYNEEMGQSPPVNDASFTPHNQPSLPRFNGQRSLPCQARVIKNRVANVYDKSQLSLKMGEIVLVTAMDPSGTWEGQLSNGERGTFPFTYIQFIDDADDAGH